MLDRLTAERAQRAQKATSFTVITRSKGDWSKEEIRVIVDGRLTEWFGHQKQKGIMIGLGTIDAKMIERRLLHHNFTHQIVTDRTALPFEPQDYLSPSA